MPDVKPGIFSYPPEKNLLYFTDVYARSSFGTSKTMFSSRPSSGTGFATAQLLQTRNHVLYQNIRLMRLQLRRRISRLSPTLRISGRIVNQIGGFPHPLGQFRQTVGVRGVLRPTTSTTSACPPARGRPPAGLSSRSRYHLCAARRFSGSVYAGRRSHRGVIHRERGLGHKRQLRRFHIQRPDVIRRFHQIHSPSGLLYWPIVPSTSG